MTTTKCSALLADVLGNDLFNVMEATFEAIGWAEDEIVQAQRRHPRVADRLFHSFILLTVGDGMGVEFVYRAHARELLERVAAGEDTRPGTAVELCVGCAKASQLAPFHTTGVGLYMRMWKQAFPDHPVMADDDQAHYEALRGSQIDDFERDLRRKTAKPDRRLGEITCGGMHHGEPVNCAYAPTQQLTLALEEAA